jgi:hypothetical protein
MESIKIDCSHHPRRVDNIVAVASKAKVVDSENDS